MEPRQPQKYEVSKGQVEVQPPRQRRFRVIKLEERIAPKKIKPSMSFCGATCDCGPW